MSAQVNEAEQQPTVPSTTATTTTKPDDTGSASAPAPVPVPMEKEVATTTDESKPSAATDNLKPATDAHPDDKKDAEKPKKFPTVDEVVTEKMALEPTAAGSEFHGLESATPSAPTHAIFDPSPEKYHENPRTDAVPPSDGIPESLIEEYISGGDCEDAETVPSNGDAAPDLEKAAKESTEDKTEKKVNEEKETAVTKPDEAVATAPLRENGTNGVAGAAKKDTEGDKEIKTIPSETAQAKEGVKAAPAPTPAPAASKKRKADDFEEDYDDNEAENHDAKKAKTEQANGNGAGADGAASPVKRAPGRPKKTAAAKVDKEARKILKPVGMTQRKTRSQGPP